MEIDVFGKKLSMAYTVASQAEIAKRFGGIENIELAFDLNDAALTMENAAFMASCLVNGANARERVRCKMMGEEPPALLDMTPEEMVWVYHPQRE